MELIDEAKRLLLEQRARQACQSGDLTQLTSLLAGNDQRDGSEKGVNPHCLSGEKEYVLAGTGGGGGGGFREGGLAWKGWSLAHYCVIPSYCEEKESKLECLKLLAKGHRVNVHKKAEDGRRPIHCAVSEISCLRSLVEDFGCNVEAKDDDGRTVLHHASMCGRIECVMYLLGEARSSADVRDRFGMTPPMYNQSLLTPRLLESRDALHRITGFFRGVVVIKCFIKWRCYRRDPFKPPTSTSVQAPSKAAKARLMIRWTNNMREWAKIEREVEVEQAKLLVSSPQRGSSPAKQVRFDSLGFRPDQQTLNPKPSTGCGASLPPQRVTSVQDSFFVIVFDRRCSTPDLALRICRGWLPSQHFGPHNLLACSTDSRYVVANCGARHCQGGAWGGLHCHDNGHPPTVTALITAKVSALP